ncbi:MAG: four helix bundle protein [Candidatus Peregrinibacteria bacterium]|nr:four helix bundle protein [Candidatus Peregrinibacteria bacterium]
MAQFRSFEEMEVWQEGRMLVRSIRGICKRVSVRRDFPFIDQVTRSARSICANIAEGNDAMTIPEFISFLANAKRSAAEVRSHLYDAVDEEYITTEEFKKLSDQCKKIASMLAKLIHHLQSLDPKLKRTYTERKPINE